MSLSKKKICDGCQKEQFIWKNHEGNKYCVGCWNKLKPQPVKPKEIKVKSIKKISDKRKEEQKIYSANRKIFLQNNSICQAGIRFICTYKSVDIHHKKGRLGNLFLDEQFWLPLCRECHLYIENNPLIARELGFSISRLNK